MDKLTALLRRYRVTSTSILILAMMLTITVTVRGAYRVERPITNGKIHQWNLYGENDNDYPTYPGGHKGIDFPAVLGTNVYAVRPGRVMDVVEGWPNGSDADNGFGNLVLIRHTKQHYVRHSNGQMIEGWRYVYSIYGHLAYMSVIVNEGDTVTEGQKIAEVDDTGGSGGNYLHLQVILDPSSNRNDGTDYDWTETHSRNPETWLPPYDNGSTQTATAIGKVTDVNGNPVSGLQIHGLQKPDQAIWNPSQYPYDWSETYNADTENPDDILVENFATTDVQPGTHCLEARRQDGSLYEDLGCHTFEAGRTTYIGLYPVYLPDVREASDWDASIWIRNNNTSDQAKANVTYFYHDTTFVYEQQLHTIGPDSIKFVNPPINNGAALSVASEDTSTMAIQRASGIAVADNAILPSTAAVGDSAFERAGTILFVPSAYNEYYNWSSTLHIQNTGNDATDVTVHLVGRGSYPDDSATLHLFPNDRGTWSPSASFGSSTTWVGSAYIEADQPLAVRIYDEQGGANHSRSYNAAAAGSTTLYVPVAYRNKWDITSGLVAQNMSANAATTVDLYFYDRNGTYRGTYSLGSVEPRHAAGVWFGSSDLESILGTSWTGSVRVVSRHGEPIAVVALVDTTSGDYYAVNAPSVPDDRVYLTYAANDVGGRTTGYTVQNPYNSSVSVTARYYNTLGSNIDHQETYTLSPHETVVRHQSYDPLPAG